MKKLLPCALLLVLSAGAVGQTTKAAQSTQSASAASSNGPVVLDYGKNVTRSGDTVETPLAEQVRHQLLLMPTNYYSVFDDIEYSLQDRTVTLTGYVTSIHSAAKQYAQDAVKRIEGVEKVVNNIKVLPPSPLDEEAREHVLRALMRTGPLSQYFWPASPDIHIIVDNQRLTLKGYVNSEGDKNLATIASNGVRDLFQVTNDLKVVK